MATLSVVARLARVEDIEEVLKLHYCYQIDSINEEDKADGFITTAFTAQQLQDLIDLESGLFVAELGGKIVAYAMAASWQFWSQWPMFAYMIDTLSESNYQGYQLSLENSYQYGPICVDKSVRGQGVFEEVFFFALNAMKSRYPVLVTFINKINRRSYVAHTQKAGLEVTREFEYGANQYYELVRLTKL